ncbi:MAG: baseplate J/gp47 family protein [Magnetospirillum sp.]|nr:baseplate J/gp47 family protein [Magnetospirillum sp.]
MPYLRPSLSQLRVQVAQDILAASDGLLLRFGNMKVTGDAQAGLANLHYGYIDYIAKQAVPFTAEGEFLEGWAALKGVVRKAPTSASGAVTFSNATPGAQIPAGAGLVRPDAVTARVTVGGTVSSGGAVTVTAAIDADPTGQAGAFGDTAAGTPMTLAQAIVGIPATGSVSTAFTGGADLEPDDSLRSRMLQAYAAPGEIGTGAQYEEYALGVPGVTRAWAVPKGFGVGTVVVYVMLDTAEAANNGFPVGTNGVASAESSRGTVATGDQLMVANAIYGQQAVTALVYVVAPTAYPVDFTIQGWSAFTAAQQSAVEAAIAALFVTNGSPGGAIDLRDIEAAINAVAGLPPWVIQAPAGNVVCPTGSLPTAGSVGGV